MVLDMGISNNYSLSRILFESLVSIRFISRESVPAHSACDRPTDVHYPRSIIVDRHEISTFG